MSIKSKVKRFLDLEPRRRRGGKAKKGRQSKRRTPPRNKNGRFRKRR